MITAGFRAQFSLKEKKMIFSFLLAQDFYFCHGRWNYFFFLDQSKKVIALFIYLSFIPML